jgi:cell division protein FtsZ
MGVGEDELLGESISVTIIATGFDVNQQNNINNIEPIKVVHALDDEKLIAQDLTDNDIKSNEPIDDKIFESKVYDLVEDIKKSNTDAMDLIPTTEEIKSIDVDFDESFDLIDSDDFIINEVNISQDEINDQNIEEQTVLTFDLPISNSKDQRDETKDFEVFKLEDNINDIEVDDYIELIAVSESSPVGEETYTINDHIVIEQTDDKFEGQSIVEVVEPEIEVDKELILKKVTIKERQVSSEPSDTVNPFDNPISKTLRDRADDRRKKMKAFNYKFNTSKIDEYEKEPAYKRQGIELSNSNVKAENQVSRTSISYDENDDIQVRSNNSFLHDNVD